MSIPDTPASSPENPGNARLRRQVGRLRALAVVALVLVVVLGVWSVIGIVTLSSQVSSLEAKIDSIATASGAETSTSGGSATSQGEAASPPSTAPEPPASARSDVALPAGVDKAGAIIVGDPDAAKFVEVYVDYQCPYCQRWETEIGAALMERALQPGSGLAVRQYNMAVLGEANRSLNPPAASARAANAAACVLDGEGVEAFVAFNAAIYAVPGGQDAASRFDTASLVGLASGVGAGDATLTCIEDQAFMPFVAATTQAAFARGVTGTPTVLINGKVIADSFGDAQLLSLLTM